MATWRGFFIVCVTAFVIPGLDPGVAHDWVMTFGLWLMPGSSPGMAAEEDYSSSIKPLSPRLRLQSGVKETTRTPAGIFGLNMRLCQ